MSDIVRSLLVKFGADTKGLESGKETVKKSLTELNTELIKNQRAVKYNNSDIASLEKEIKNYEKSVKDGKETTKEQTEQYEKNKEILEKLIQKKAELKTKEQELKSQISQTTKELNEQGNAAKANKESIEKLGNALKTAAKFAAGIATGAFTLAYSTAQYADEVNTLSKQTGVATDEIQKLQYASELIDVSFDRISDSLAELKDKMLDAKEGSEAKKYFDQLSVSVLNSNGELRYSYDVFNDVVNALDKIENSTERDAIAMKIFGESARELNTLFDGGIDTLNEYGESLKNSGLILSQQQLDKLNSFNDKVDDFKSKITATSRIVSVDAIEAFDSLFEKSDEIIEIVSGMAKAFLSFTGFLVDNKEIVLALIATMATYKASMAIGDVIANTVNAVKLFTTATETATTAQVAFNTVANTNPYVLIGSALIAVIGGIVAFCSATSSAKEEVKSLNDEIQEAQRSIIADGKVAKELANRYDELAKKTSLTAAEQEELKNITAELNKIYPNELKFIDEKTGKYIELANQIDNLIEKQKKEAELEAVKDIYSETYKQQIEQEIIKNQSESILKKYGVDVTKTTKEERQDIFWNWYQAGGYTEEEKKEFEDALQSYETAEEKLKGINEQLDGISEKYSQILKETTENTEQLSESIDVVYEKTEEMQALSDNRSAINILIEAQKEMTEYGYLSEKTVNIMLNSNSDLIKSLKEVDGKYQLVDGSLKSYTDSLKISNNVVLQAKKAAVEIINAESDKKAAFTDTTNSIKEQLKATISLYSGQMRALEYEAGVKGGRKLAESLEQTDKNYASLKAKYKAFSEALMNLTDAEALSNALDSTSKNENNKTSNNNTITKSEKKVLSAYELATQAFKKLVDERIEAIQKLTDTATESANQRIKAIDDEVEARKRLKEDADLQKEIEAVQAQLKYSQLDSFSRSELENTLKKLKEQQAETEYEREIERKKQEITNQLSETKIANEKLIEKLKNQEAYANQLFSDLQNGYKSASSIVNNNSTSANINIVNNALTAGQIAKKIIDELTDGIY